MKNLINTVLAILIGGVALYFVYEFAKAQGGQDYLSAEGLLAAAKNAVPLSDLSEYTGGVTTYPSNDGIFSGQPYFFYPDQTTDPQATALIPLVGS